MNVKIAAGQMNIQDGKVEENLSKAKSMVELASKKEADVIVFPELFLTGGLGPDFHPYADSIPGKYSDIFSKLSREYGIYIIMGSIYERLEGKFYNTSALIDDKGEVLGVYRKNKLWITERENLASSSERPVFNTKFGKIGIMICWDLAFPEVARTMAKQGAKIIFTPIHWSVADFTPPPYNDLVLREKSNWFLENQMVNTFVYARALENNVIMVLVNGFGEYESQHGKQTFIGQSQIVTPFYGPIHKASKEEVLVGEINTNLADIAETKLMLLKDSD